METLLRDAQHALRALRGSPGFTLTAVLSLALGLGATTAIFSVVDTLVLRRPPYPEPDQLVTIWSAYPGRGITRLPTSPSDFQDFRQQAPSFDAMAAFSPADLNLSGGGSPERVRAITVSGDLLHVLRVRPLLGRGFLPEEEVPGRNHVVLLSYGLWKRRFGQDPGVLGRSMTLDAQEHTIIGVLPRTLDVPSSSVQVWVPLAVESSALFDSRSTHFLEVLARLKPGITEERGRKDLEAVAQRLGEQHPESDGLGVALVPLREQRAGDFRTGLLVTLGAVFFVLLIACANVANLMLARGARRQREMAIRAALGATRGRLVRQLLTESVLLALMGGSVGVLLAYLGVSSARALVPAEVTQLEGVGLDGRVMAFALVLAVGTGLLFGILPALRNSRLDLMDALKESAPTSARGGARLRGLLVCAEVALALMLLVGGGLMLHSLQKTLSVDPGFKPDGVLTVGVTLPEAKYKDPRLASSFFREIIERVTHLPRVESAGAVSSVPMSNRIVRMPVLVDGRPENPELRLQDLAQADIRAVEGDYFKAMRISLVKGRLFEPKDGPGSVRVALINEAAINQVFYGEDPIGKQLILGPPEHLLPKSTLDQLPGGKLPRFTVVGVLHDVRSQGLRNPVNPEVYVIQSQNTEAPPSMVLTVRASGDLASLVPTLRGVVAEMDPEQAISEARRMEEYVNTSLSEPRLMAIFLTAFAIAALSLAMIGVSGVVGYSVTQRMREFGIRLALGASSGHIIGLVFKEGGLWVGLGMALGLGGALSLRRVLEGLLFELNALDPLTYAVVILGLLGATLVALYAPARRATSVDPTICLRID